MSSSGSIMAARLKRLPRRHRLAHLRALIRRDRLCPVRRLELTALLQDEQEEQSARLAKGGRAT